MKELILKALKEKEIFIGYYMLCRYLNNKGYKRFGCNAGYNKPFTNGKDKLNPCKILCPGTKIYHSKIRYWCKKLFLAKELFLMKTTFLDSKNPNSKTKPHKLDVFVFIALNEQIIQEYFKNRTLEGFL